MSKNKDLFGDEIEGSGQSEFEKFMNTPAGPGRKLRPGDVFRGEILTIGKEEAFVATGTPVDGVLPVSELLDSQKQLKYKVSDAIEVKVVRLREGEIFLKRADSTAASEDLESLEDAFDMELPIEGKVTEPIKGGFRVSVMGKSAFCPISQMDARVGQPEDYIGKKFEFIITQFEPDRRNIVVSRRRVLDLRRAEFEGEFLQQHKVNEIIKGKIVRTEKYGAFVELEGGVQGLIPISEIAWGRVQSPLDVVFLGQDVDVMILKMEEDGDRLKISLSLKQAGGEGDPWTKIHSTFPVGRVTEGTIERRENYGVFVSLAPGITGLLPRSKWRDRLDAQSYENRKKGEKIVVQIDEIKFEEKRISLAPPSEGEDNSWKEHSTTAPGKGMGTFGDLLKGFKAKP